MTCPVRLSPGLTLVPKSPSLILVSDASRIGWGSTLGHLEISGKWSVTESNLHINILELRAIHLALKHWTSLVMNKTVAVCSDNTTALSYIKKEGGTKSRALYLEAWNMLVWAEKMGVTIITQFIKGRDKVQADQLSREMIVQPTEWTLQKEVCLSI